MSTAFSSRAANGPSSSTPGSASRTSGRRTGGSRTGPCSSSTRTATATTAAATGASRGGRPPARRAATLTGRVDARASSQGYLEVARAQLAAYQRARESDDRFFHLFTAATRPRPVPAPPTVDSARRPAPTPLADGERIDLAGGSYGLHTPGHSPDSLCLLDEPARPAVRRRHTHHRRLLGAHAGHRDRGLRGHAAQARGRAGGRSDRDLPGPHSPLPRQAGLPASGGRRLRGDRGRFQHRQARHRPAATPGVTA